MRTRFVLLVVAAGLLIAMFWNRATVAEDTPRKIEVTATRFMFSPAELTLKKGVPVVLSIKSTDVNHGLRLRDLNIDLKINKGGTTEVRLTPDKVGDFVGHCSVFCGAGHGGMALTLHVVE
jgi:cytochrome c oxidase subunit II